MNNPDDAAKDIHFDLHKGQTCVVGGYIGKSTRGEIEYALSRGIPVRYLEPVDMEVWKQAGE